MILTTCAGRDGDDHGDGVDGIVAGDTENDGDGEDGGDGTSDGDEKLANAMMMVLMTLMKVVLVLKAIIVAMLVLRMRMWKERKVPMMTTTMILAMLGMVMVM